MRELIFHGSAIYTGVDSLKAVRLLASGRVMIITGQGSTFTSGTMSKLTELLIECKLEYCVYSGIKKNPTTDAVLEGLKEMRAYRPDCVIAIGGGSPIDAAKVMVFLYDNPELELMKLSEMDIFEISRVTKLIAIPTTSGTGTEVTKSAVVTYAGENIKIGLKSKAFIPDAAILDAGLTLTMPSNVVAETGMDAMTHAVECYINKASDDFTDCLAAGAIEGLFEHLVPSYKTGAIEHRAKVHNYQCMAGCAFANVGLGMAHGISHSIGGMFDAGHGLINAVVLPYVLEFNSKDEEVRNKLSYLAKRVGCESFIDGIRKLNRELNIPSYFREMGIDKSAFMQNLEDLAENSLKGSTRVNPVAISKSEMNQLLLEIFGQQ